MRSFGISGAEALDPSTRVFVCLFVTMDICMLTLQPTCIAAKQHTF